MQPIWSNSDISSIQPTGKNRPFAKEANALMASASSFLAAYGSFDANAKGRLLSELEVRCAMRVHQKKCEARTSFLSLEHIAKAMRVFMCLLHFCLGMYTFV